MLLMQDLEDMGYVPAGNAKEARAKRWSCTVCIRPVRGRGRGRWTLALFTMKDTSYEFWIIPRSSGEPIIGTVGINSYVL